MNLYPRSFLRLILTGWLLTALPLLIAIAFASVSLKGLSERSAISMLETAEAARLAWELDEDILTMERLLRQYEALQDRSLIDDYLLAQKEWSSHLDELVRLPLLASLSDEVSAIRTLEATAQPPLLADAPDVEPMLNTFEALKNRISGLIKEIDRLSEAERQTFRNEAERLQQQLLIAIALALLAALLLFWAGQRTVAQLFRGVERAVIALGNNLLERPIELKGTNDLRWIGKRLEWLRRRMLALEEERTRILRHVSHELKTPLAALREGSSLLADGVAGPLSIQQDQIAAIMQGNVLRLQALIDGLLKLQQAEHVRERIEPVSLRLDELVQQILATHKLAARDKHLRITGRLAPLTLVGGREEITTIIDNLLSNAVKFSPPRGTVRIELSRNMQNAVLDVFDEGPGVPEEERKMIFEPFYRGTAAKSVAGVGLGLAIARELAVAHRGMLEYLSDEAATHFRVTLPLTAELP
ncbi:sensor histidine kinase [Sulfuricystis multivorans]|uniref:sensor histidine kinase n=1 Tax=Sulfuricystis multivorans TaxID=2211108 RepID=UPI001559511D|nr:HAMP domain-containing sensor histidine kinase [Sulfuricystis multivorans]